MSDTEQVNEKYTAFLEEAKGLKTTLEALKKYNNIEDLSEKLPLTDFAQLNASLAYCLNSLYYMYMKANGISFEEHKINQEIERVKQYFTKIQEVILAEEAEKKNPLAVNKEAADRMIRAHLQDQFIKDENSVLLIDDDDLNQENLAGQENESPNQESLDIEKSEEKKPKKKQKLHKGSLLPSGAHLSWKEELDKMLK